MTDSAGKCLRAAILETGELVLLDHVVEVCVPSSESQERPQLPPSSSIPEAKKLTRGTSMSASFLLWVMNRLPLTA